MTVKSITPPPPQGATGNNSNNYCIALIRPNFEIDTKNPILALGYLASYLKVNGYNALIVDAMRDNLSNDDVLAILKKENINVAGISCLTTHADEAVALSKCLKGAGIKVIIGGVHPTFMPYQTLTASGADYVVCGEGEIALLKLAENDFNNTLTDGSKIKGVYSLNELKDENTAVVRADFVENLDDIPYPDWEQLQPAHKAYTTWFMIAKDSPSVGIMSSRGCPYSCKFCSSPDFYSKRVRMRSPENVLGEMRLLKEKYGIREIKFVDDNITVDREYIDSLCDAIIKDNLNLPLFTMARADRLDDALVKVMKRAGFYNIAIGIESASPVMLLNMNKREDIGAIKTALKILHNNDILITGLFVFGMPGETKQTIKETIDFILSEPLDLVNVSILAVLPGSDYWNELEGQYTRRFNQSYWGDVNYVPEGLVAEDVLAAQKQTYRRFFLRPRVIFKLLQYIRLRHIGYFLTRIRNIRFFGK
ncbi:B12-binding domain-containing radical SAM protein [Deferribacterales bacterium]|nr:B12-binding domain-containing radical SAM protein [Deferribacterales bacterium]